MCFHKVIPICLMILSQLGSCDAGFALVCLEIIIIGVIFKADLVKNHAVWQKNVEAKILVRRNVNIFSTSGSNTLPGLEYSGEWFKVRRGWIRESNKYSEQIIT